MKPMHLNNPKSRIFIPDDQPPTPELARTTHLGIGAHSDDLEFMAYHGIAACYDTAERWFSGVTVTDGAGSVRTGPFANLTTEELAEVRAREQDDAARIGQYAAMLQLGYTSDEIKTTRAAQVEEELLAILDATTPEIVYTHQPADKHPTHIATLLPALRALRRLPAERRPKSVYGCEVWRDLDWLPDDAKIALDVSPHPALAERLTAVFVSQIQSGKRYDLAVPGRRHANATFSNPHATDEVTAVSLALDLTPLLEQDTLDVAGFITPLIERFRDGVAKTLTDLSRGA